MNLFVIFYSGIFEVGYSVMTPASSGELVMPQNGANHSVSVISSASLTLFESVVEHFQVLDSTQTYIRFSMLNWITSSDSIARLMCVSSEHQTQGRGKGDRHWFSDPGSKCLALSFGFVVPENRLGDSAILTQLLALSVVRSFPDVEVRIKWPNDLVIEGKKVGGILAELEPVGECAYVMIIGVGLNLDINPVLLHSVKTRWPAGSLQAFCRPGVTIDLFETRDCIIDIFQGFVSIFLRNNPQEISVLTSEISHCQFRYNEEIRFCSGDSIIRGVHRGLDPRGGLLISTTSSFSVSTFYSGELVLDSVPYFDSPCFDTESA